MGCNTSQELKTKDGATSNGDDTNPMENGQLENGNANGGPGDEQHHHHHQKGGSAAAATAAKSSGSMSATSGNHTNHSKSNSIISNKDGGGSLSSSSAKQNGLQHSGGDGGEHRRCDKAEISELNDMDMGEDEAKAAVKIQAVFRGHKVRNTMMKKTDDTKPTTTTNTTASTSNAAAAAVAAADEPTKEELEAEFDPNDKELCDAALKIQAAFRGHLTRKVVTKDDAAEDVDIQEITKKVAEELDIDLTDPELHKAATKIQASFRGHKTRKDGSD